MNPSPTLASPTRIRRWSCPSIAALAVVLLATACGDSGPTQGDVAASLADHVVIPAMAEAATATATLHERTESFCAQPSDDTLASVRTAWSAARRTWRHTESMSFGPRSTNRITSQIDHTSTDPTSVETLLSAGDIPDAAAVRTTLGAQTRGLGAIEYLLFGPGDPTLDDHCELLMAYTAAVAEAVAEVEQGWTEGNDGIPAYRDVFAGDTGSMTGRDAVAEAVEGSVFALRAMTTFGIGRALGVTSPEPDPQAVLEGPAGKGAVDYTARIAGITDLYRGTATQPGLGDLVAVRSDEVNATIEGVLDDLPGLVAEVGSPFREGLVENPEAGQALFDALDMLRISYETDVVSLLDVVIGFSDSDGDTG